MMITKSALNATSLQLVPRSTPYGKETQKPAAAAAIPCLCLPIKMPALIGAGSGLCGQSEDALEDLKLLIESRDEPAPVA
jgi:hypothetical protein